SYSDQLEDYIVRYKRRPPDIKHWPYGPYWPRHFDGLLLNSPRHLWSAPREPELLAIGDFGRRLHAVSRTIDNQTTHFKGKWRGVQVAYDSERSSRDFSPLPVPEGCCPSLVFESRFECGNLRQARRVGQFEYELVLKPDLYTLRHTQWYYFRVTNAVPGVTYKLRIVNLLKRDSLYNHGMRPLLYSENDAQEKQRGWVRTGHHISYSRNLTNHNCPLLQRGVTYHMLEWQMEFQNPDDTYYLAHCYPYSFTDLKEDLEVLMNSEERAQVTRRTVLCETRAGNSCFLLTVTNFNSKEEKKGIVISGRVHPGESQASWMMKGLLEFITGPDPEAQVALYCDLHGHSRKPNVFMYGNNTSSEADNTPVGSARAFISERLFPWLMSLRSPEKFHFKSCKFQIRRCKESTGRVVMWRQLHVFNSFTLEATFSGTVLDRDSCRHFNILDFMEMGKVLAQTVLDYHRAQEDQTTQTQAVLGLTQVLTEQVLVSKGLLEPGTGLEGFGPSNTGTCRQSFVSKGLLEPGTGLEGFGPTNTVPLEASEAAKVRESAEKWTGALLALLNTPRETAGAVTKDAVTPTGSGLQATEEKGGAGGGGGRGASGPQARGGGAQAVSGIGAETSQRAVFSRADVAQMLENVSGGRSMEDCLSFLSQIGVQDAIDESDSSDSDSESEPEMKIPEPKTRKKKRKSKKHRDKDHEKKHSVGEKKGGDDTKLKALSASSGSEKTRTNRQLGSFISKYEGRHNGGVPCFTEERSMERAAKCVDDSGLHPTTNEEFNKRLKELGEDNPALAATLLGLNVRTGYTHAEHLQDSSLSPSHGQGVVSPYLMSALATQGYRPEQTDLVDHSSSDSCCDDDSDNNINNITTTTANNNNTSNNRTTRKSKLLSIRKAPTLATNGKEMNKTVNNKYPCYGSGPFSIKSYRHYNASEPANSYFSISQSRDFNPYTVNAKEAESSSTENHLCATSDTKYVRANGDTEESLWGSTSLPVTARRNPYVQLEPLTDRSLSTLSLSKHPQSLPETKSAPGTLGGSLVAQHTKQQTGDAKNNTRVQLDSLRKTEQDSSIVDIRNSNYNTLKASSHSQRIGEARTSTASHNLEQSKHASLVHPPSKGCTTSDTLLSTTPSSSSSTMTRSSSEASKSKSKSTSKEPFRMKTTAVNTGSSTSNSDISRKHNLNHDVLYNNTVGGASVAPPNIYTYFAVFSSVPGVGLKQPLTHPMANPITNSMTNFMTNPMTNPMTNSMTQNTAQSLPNPLTNPNLEKKEHSTAADKKSTHRRPWASDLDPQPTDEAFSVDRLVSSLSQSLSAVGPTSGSTVAKRHAHYNYEAPAIRPTLSTRPHTPGNDIGLRLRSDVIHRYIIKPPGRTPIVFLPLSLQGSQVNLAFACDQGRSSAAAGLRLMSDEFTCCHRGSAGRTCILYELIIARRHCH
ncbi:hypothetical protein EGW08_000449, partial [Elysia chlorotica]